MTDTERNNLGRALYKALNRDTKPIAWDDLPVNRQERYRIAAVEFVTSVEVDAYLESVRQRIAA